MSRTIEAIMTHMAPATHNAMPVHAKPLTANWQTGLGAGGHVQRKLNRFMQNRQFISNAARPDNMRARHFDCGSHNEAMKRLVFVSAVIFVALLFVGCGRKSQPAGPPAPE